MKIIIISVIIYLNSISTYCQTLEIKEALDFLNNVRANPNAFSNEIGVSLIDVEPMPSLKWNNQLAVVAQRKAQDMADRNYFAHIDPDGYGMNYFINKAGYNLNSDWLVNISNNNFESLSAGNSNPRQSIINLIKDEGVIGIGHRKHLLGIDNFWKSCYDIGIGWGYNMNSKYKTYCCVLIAKHDWYGYTGNTVTNNLNETNKSSQSYYNTYYKDSKLIIESEENKNTVHYKLISFKIGSSVNVFFENINKLNGTLNDQLAYQINTMIGINLGKHEKNTNFGIFGNYGKYNSRNTTLLNNTAFLTKDDFIEFEGGFLIKEFFRLSGGLGYSNFNSISFNSYNYNTITAGFSFGPKWFKLDVMNTLMKLRNNEKYFFRPSLGISIVLNTLNKKSH